LRSRGKYLKWMHSAGRASARQAAGYSCIDVGWLRGQV
jgi:hypothetical protein